MEAPFGCVAVSVSTKGVTFLDVRRAVLPTQLNPGRRRRQEERANKREMRPSDYDGRCQFVTLPHLSVG